jgi:hypothetical protein
MRKVTSVVNNSLMLNVLLRTSKYVASNTIKYDVFDVSCFIILILNLNTSGCLQSNLRVRLLIVRTSAEVLATQSSHSHFL